MNQTVSATSLQTAAPRSAATVSGELSFIVPQDEKPSFHSAAMTGDVPKVFFKTEKHAVEIADMRPLAGALSLDVEGFELVRAPTAVADLYDDVAVEQAYFAEIEALLTARFNASRIAIFDATRRSDGGAGAANPDGRRGPASRLHVDYTARSGPQRVRDVLGEAEAERLAASGARVVQVNVWRPIAGPVQRAPLALADASSVRPEELVATDQVFPDRVGEIYHIAHSDDQRWYWAPDMERDEVLLIKGWDSLDDGRAQYTPHGAFEQPDTDPNAPPRESIEIRTLVIVE